MLTRYEIVASHPDGRRWLVGYSPRKSRAGLLDAMRNVGDALIAKLPIGERDEMTLGSSPLPHALVAGWRVGFTGRTQLDARHAGEVPFILNSHRSTGEPM